MDLAQDYFSLFKLPCTFALDLQELDSRYRTCLSVHHPDRFVISADDEKQRSIEVATQINQAYRTLKSPLSRAQYLLQLQGVDTQTETDTAMPMDFLMSQMQWREMIEVAHHSQNIGWLEKLNGELRSEISALEAHLGELIDGTRDYAAAVLAVRKLHFFDKLDHDIGDAIETILS